MENAAHKKRFSAYRARRPGSRPLLTLEAAKAADDVALNILDFMQRYDLLPPSYVKAQPFSTPAYIEKCLTVLQKGHYVGIPKAQPKDIYAFHWLEVWPRGFSYLGDRALGRALVNDPFPHKCLRSVIEYHRDQLPALVTPLAVPSIELRAKTLYPDNHWKIEYREVKTATMYFFEEDDTGTERGRGDENFERYDKSLRTMIREYNEYFVHGHYLNQFSTISVLIHTTKKRRVDTILSIVDEEMAPQWKPRIAIKAVPDFLEYPELLPKPNDNIVATDYVRIGKSGQRERFNIMDTLKATELRKRGGEISGR
ncbi:hypothetical protein [Bradyrhizobium guangzhouense]|uniref:Uncharacterized protein n=1 Tax=Bradyrhizobium guangzhouense TaxID=1325095 RepID=A0AAE5X6U4_9BRAD|nr:hypothetical protein [Bradyrhizobium guangzhouense]QAU49664.1 hypothetical protein XH91_32735 [Bradyrhizobium guangzhouense]